MPSFIMALKINPNARKEHPNLSAQINESLDIFAEHSVTVNNLFATLGRYDYIAIFEADDQNSAFRVANQINSRGILQTETWPVIDYDDFSKII
ncbi:MAG TPA: GYD domain-containing protein [candidate division Zixibacteria bacterium]|nr:GYD domain-containing protein [candidate division Zixibacteria bacterium]